MFDPRETSEQGADPGAGPAREAEIAQVLAEIDRAQARLLRLVGGWDVAGEWAGRAPTPVCALRALGPIGRARAAATLRTARFVHVHTATAAALDSGEVSAAHVEVLARAASDTRAEHYRRDEPTLLEAARHLSVDDLGQVARRWAFLADDDLARTDAARAHDNRHLHASITYEGAVRLDGWLPADAGAVVMAALDRHGAPPSADDHRSTAQRRADALVDVARAALAPTAGSAPAAAIDVRVDLATLTGLRAGDLGGIDVADARCDLSTGPISRTTLERLGCDALVGWVLADRGEPLAVGRHLRTITPAQRRALAVRDEHCTYPGCDRPPPWCDGHHLAYHAAHLGPTDLDNLALVCRHHHTRLHHDHTTLARDGHGAWRVVPAPTGPDPP